MVKKKEKKIPNKRNSDNNYESNNYINNHYNYDEYNENESYHDTRYNYNDMSNGIHYQQYHDNNYNDDQSMDNYTKKYKQSSIQNNRYKNNEINNNNNRSNNNSNKEKRLSNNTNEDHYNNKEKRLSNNSNNQKQINNRTSNVSNNSEIVPHQTRKEKKAEARKKYEEYLFGTVEDPVIVSLSQSLQNNKNDYNVSYYNNEAPNTSNGGYNNNGYNNKYNYSDNGNYSYTEYDTNKNDGKQYNNQSQKNIYQDNDDNNTEGKKNQKKKKSTDKILARSVTPVQEKRGSVTTQEKKGTESTRSPRKSSEREKTTPRGAEKKAETVTEKTTSVSSQDKRINSDTKNSSPVTTTTMSSDKRGSKSSKTSGTRESAPQPKRQRGPHAKQRTRREGGSKERLEEPDQQEEEISHEPSWRRESNGENPSRMKTETQKSNVRTSKNNKQRERDRERERRLEENSPRNKYQNFTQSLEIQKVEYEPPKISTPRKESFISDHPILSPAQYELLTFLDLECETPPLRAVSTPCKLADHDPDASNVDIRCHDLYTDFYNYHGGDFSTLPPPIECNMDIIEESERRSSPAHSRLHSRVQSGLFGENIYSPSATPTNITSHAMGLALELQRMESGDGLPSTRVSPNRADDLGDPLKLHSPVHIDPMKLKQSKTWPELDTSSLASKKKKKFLENVANSRHLWDETNCISVNGVLRRRGFIKNQMACRMMQKILGEAYSTPEEIDIVLYEVNDELPHLMTDQYGYFLCSKIISTIYPEGLTRMVNSCSQYLWEIAFNWHGTRLLNKIIEIICREQDRNNIKLFSELLTPYITPVTCDSHGNHVIQKLLLCYKQEDLEFVYNNFSNNIVEIANNRHGCCILQRCIETASPEVVELLIQRSCDNAIELMEDPFGNYVIQFILNCSKEIDDDTWPHILAQKIKGNVYRLALQKFASNALEQCFEICNPTDRAHILPEIFDSQQNLYALLKNDYGNYVIQKILDLLDGKELDDALMKFPPIFANNDGEGQIRRVRVKLLQKFPKIAKEVNRLNERVKVDKEAPKKQKNNKIWQTFHSTDATKKMMWADLSLENPE